MGIRGVEEVGVKEWAVIRFNIMSWHVHVETICAEIDFITTHSEKLKQTRKFTRTYLQQNKMASDERDPNVFAFATLLFIPRILLSIGQILGAVFSNGDLDPLSRKRLAQWCALDHSWELLGTIHLKRVAVCCCQHRCFAGVELAGALRRIVRADIHEIAFQTEVALRPHTEVLQYEPEAQLAFVVVQLEGVDCQTADQVSREHAGGWRGHNRNGNGCGLDVGSLGLEAVGRSGSAR